ncbi:MAG: hypothetical protein ACOYL6_00380 [Bacteriovoracaceae bacterium]
MEKVLPFASKDIIADFILRSVEGLGRLDILELQQDLRERFQYASKDFNYVIDELIEGEFIHISIGKVDLTPKGHFLLKESPSSITLEQICILKDKGPEQIVYPPMKDNRKLVEIFKTYLDNIFFKIAFALFIFGYLYYHIFVEFRK